jgi:hypothetical protein
MAEVEEVKKPGGKGNPRAPKMVFLTTNKVSFPKLEKSQNPC